MKNRLKLDFTLESARERVDFVNTYIVQFTDLTQGEAATIADYLLWGKDEEGNALGADAGLETRWTKTDESESLDAVLENPALANIQLKSLNDAVVYRKPREVFDRGKTRKEAPEYLRDTFENLWRLIDEVDLEIGFYEERVGKRDKPPREELLKRFSDDEIERIRAASHKLNQYGYLKLRRRLVELRREQFTIRDSYQSTFNITQSIFQPRNRTFVFDCDIEVLPLGLADTAVGRLIFDLVFDPARFSEEQLRSISKLVWDKKKINPEVAFDFRNLEAVYQLYLFKEDIGEQIERDKTDHKVEANQQSLIDTLRFYEQIADLSDLQLDILRLKEKKVKNQDIADYVNKTYGKNYTANYISTIFRQKIIVKINEAAELHKDTIENCFFPENFRKCPECGRVLLLDSRNWIRKSRSKDGFQNKCKRCERKARKRK